MYKVLIFLAITFVMNSCLHFSGSSSINGGFFKSRITDGPACSDAGDSHYDDQLVFTWDNPNLNNIRMQIAKDSLFSELILGDSGGYDLNFVDGNATYTSYTHTVNPADGALYYARVKIQDAEGNWSNWGTASDGITLYGTIIAKIKDTNLNNLAGLTVTLRNNSDEDITSTVSGADGTFTFSDVPIGNIAYKLAVTGTAVYLSAVKGQISVNLGTTDHGVIFLVPNDALPGKISGTVIDANLGTAHEGVSIKFFDWSGIEVTTAGTVTASDGTFTSAGSNLFPGSYTLNVEKDGYYMLITTSPVNGNINTGQLAICGNLAAPQVRLVLQWGAKPTDMDIHVVGVTDSSQSDATPVYDNITNGKFHLWSWERSYDERTGNYWIGLPPYGDGSDYLEGDITGDYSTASLVQDVNSGGYGPEAVNFYSGYKAGTYTVTVHSFSSEEWSVSNPFIKIYDDQGLVTIVNCPSSHSSAIVANNYWKAFKLIINPGSRPQTILPSGDPFFDTIDDNYSDIAVFDWEP